MPFNLCTSSAIIALAGDGASSSALATDNADQAMPQISTMIEGELCLFTKFDWVTNLGSVANATTSAALAEVCAAGCAFHVIDFDKSGYLDNEAEVKMNNTYDRYISGLTRLADEDGRQFILTGERN